MSKSDYLFRPINVPKKNKWLRQMAIDFRKNDAMLMSSYDMEKLYERIVEEIHLQDSLKNLAWNIL